MKILMISPWFPNKTNPVIGVYVRDIAKAVSVHCEVFIFSSYIDKLQNQKKVLNSKDENIYITQLEYYQLKIPIVSYLLYIYNIFKELNTEIKKINPDIIHAHVYTYGFIGILFGKKFGIPVVITEHVQVQFPYTVRVSKKIKHYFHRLSAKFTYSHANTLIAVSKSLKESIQSLGRTNQIFIIPNIVDSKIFYLKTGARKSGDIKKILYVGGLSEIKGVIYLLQALHAVKQVRQDFILDIIGLGPEMSHLQEFTIQHGLSPYVKFHGRLQDKEDVAVFMRETDFFILPSLYEPFGIVLIEALACGKPVISTTSGGQSDFITEKNGILVPPGDVKSLHNAIIYMLDNIALYNPEEMSRDVKEKFNSEAIGQTLFTVYNDTIKGE